MKASSWENGADARLPLEIGLKSGGSRSADTPLWSGAGARVDWPDEIHLV